ncbi:retinol dehydrogenase 8-like [Diadema antillarum]|uniref:retinol dehydrogenase 8-like n=1 Tax=Diadema antillarum TaxID=105358 RepID=UPI003A8B6924
MTPQVVLVTGCASGIGLCAARRLAQDPDQRYLVIATVIAMSEKAELVAAVGDAIDKTIFIKEMNMTKDEDITRVVDDVIKAHGRIDILINIAGITTLGVPERVSRARIESIFNVNTIGTIRLTLAVLPHMKQKKAGRIISVTSVDGVIGKPYNEIYCASKCAVEGFFESLLPAVKSFNIRVSMIEPNQVKTGMVLGAWMEFKAQLSDNTIHDIDRRQLRCLAESSGKHPAYSADDVVDVLTKKCIEVDEPIFRHLLVSPDYQEKLVEVANDLTGEKKIALLCKDIGAS